MFVTKMRYYVPIFETQIDGDNYALKTYENNLPHETMIKAEMLSFWNKSDIRQYLNTDLKEKVTALKLSFTHKNNQLIAIVNVICPKNTYFTEKLRQHVIDFLDGQMCDGWGECFFGFNNIMTAHDGTKFIVE